MPLFRPESAADLIAAEIANGHEPLTLLATGPLSNLADALGRFDAATLSARLQSVVSMGGAVHFPGELLEPDPRFDNTQTVNYWVDPVGTQEVFDLVPTGKLTMVPHDATRFVPITFPFLAELAASAVTPEAQYVSAMMSHPYVQAGLQYQPAYWWDPLAATATNKDGRGILGYEWDRIDIIEEGPSAGRTLALSPSDPGAWVHVAIWADQNAFETSFLQMLDGAE